MPFPQTDLAALPQSRQAPPSRRTRSRRVMLGLAGLFGIAVATGWHFLHLLSEPYQFNLSDPHLWFHLGLELAVALYATSLFLIIWRLTRRFR